jgi:hypothetical protein
MIPLTRPRQTVGHARDTSVPRSLPCIALLYLLPATAFGGSGVGGGATDPAEHPWEKPRGLNSFQSLLKHSPFSLPTAEDSSPLAERYAMTGIVTIDGEDQIFVFDRTDQSRELVGRSPNIKNMSLVSLIREGSTSPQKASIMVGGESGTIGFLESAQPQGMVSPAAQPVPGSVSAGTPGAQNPQQRVQLPPLPPLPQEQPGSQSAQTGRRIIRRPMIQAPQSQSPTP